MNQYDNSIFPSIFDILMQNCGLLRLISASLNLYYISFSYLFETDFTTRNHSNFADTKLPIQYRVLGVPRRQENKKSYFNGTSQKQEMIQNGNFASPRKLAQCGSVGKFKKIGNFSFMSVAYRHLH